MSVFREVKGERMALDMVSNLLLLDVPSARSSTAARGSRRLLELLAAMLGDGERGGRGWNAGVVSLRRVDAVGACRQFPANLSMTVFHSVSAKIYGCKTVLEYNCGV